MCRNFFLNAVQQGYRPVIYRVRHVPLLKKQDNVGFEPFLGQRLVEVVVTYPPNELLDRGGEDVLSVVVCEVPPTRLVGLGPLERGAERLPGNVRERAVFCGFRAGGGVCEQAIQECARRAYSRLPHRVRSVEEKIELTSLGVETSSVAPGRFSVISPRSTGLGAFLMVRLILVFLTRH